MLCGKEDATLEALQEDGVSALLFRVRGAKVARPHALSPPACRAQPRPVYRRGTGRGDRADRRSDRTEVPPQRRGGGAPRWRLVAFDAGRDAQRRAGKGCGGSERRGRGDGGGAAWRDVVGGGSGAAGSGSQRVRACGVQTRRAALPLARPSGFLTGQSGRGGQPR